MDASNWTLNPPKSLCLPVDTGESSLTGDHGKLKILDEQWIGDIEDIVVRMYRGKVTNIKETLVEVASVKTHFVFLQVEFMENGVNVVPIAITEHTGESSLTGDHGKLKVFDEQWIGDIEDIVVCMYRGKVTNIKEALDKCRKVISKPC